MVKLWNPKGRRHTVNRGVDPKVDKAVADAKEYYHDNPRELDKSIRKAIKEEAEKKS